MKKERVHRPDKSNNKQQSLINNNHLTFNIPYSIITVRVVHEGGIMEYLPMCLPLPA
jgi:hypothetical protein